mgnify:CR=1 FL=1
MPAFRRDPHRGSRYLYGYDSHRKPIRIKPNENYDINISLSPSPGELFDTLFTDIPDNGTYLITLPEINSETAIFKIWSYDHYGNYGENTANDFFTIELLVQPESVWHC